MSKPVIALAVLMFSAAQAWADDVTYRKDIRPLWQAKCSACHGAASPYLGDFLENQDKYVKMMKGPRMDTYADLIFFIGWPDTGAIMRRLDNGENSKGGKPGNMYQYLGTSEDEREQNYKLFKKWVGEDAWTHKRWDKKGDTPGVTKQELEQMKLKY